MSPGDRSEAIQVEVIFYTSCAFLLTVFLVSTALVLRGNQAARYFLWVWTAPVILVLPLMNRANVISHIAAGLMLVFLLYVLYITVHCGMECVDVSHEETRRVLIESDRRIDEERCIPTCRPHNEVNPQPLPTYSVLKQLEPLVAGDGRAAELLDSAPGILNDTYVKIYDIIKNTRIEMIDSIGFTVTLESLVTHYMNTSEKPTTTLRHDLLKWPAMLEAPATGAYEIIREAIFNAIKHSKTAQVRANIHHSETLDIYKVEITDDGMGVRTTARSGKHADVGLIDMCE